MGSQGIDWLNVSTKRALCTLQNITIWDEEIFNGKESGHVRIRIEEDGRCGREAGQAPVRSGGEVVWNGSCTDDERAQGRPAKAADG